MTQGQRIIQSNDEKISSMGTMCFTSFDDDERIKELQDKPEISDPEEQANMILHQAQIEAENIIQNARSKANEIINDAFHAGYREGQGKAMNELGETVDSLTKLFNGAIDQVAIIKNEIINNAEDDIIELTIAVAEKLVCHEIEQNHDFIINVIRETIRIAKSASEMHLRVCPEDRKLLEKNAKELIEFAVATTFNPDLKLIIEDDESLVPGDCVVITDKNIFDMTFKSRLDSVIETINVNRSQA